MSASPGPMVTEIAAPVTAAAYRDAMAQVGAAVHLVTTDGPAGRAGFTASAVCSLSDAPPMLLVCLNRQASVHPAFEGNGVVCVNTLGAGHAALAALFGGRTPMASRFDAASWVIGATGAPQLLDALVSLDCRVLRTVREATHDVLFCEVVKISARKPAAALIYRHRRFHTLPAP